MKHCIDHFPNLTNIHINSEHFEDAAFYAKYRHIEFLYSIRDIDIIYEPNVNFEILALFHKLILFEPIAKKIIAINTTALYLTDDINVFPKFFHALRYLKIDNNCDSCFPKY